MRFFYESSTETEESDGALPNDVKGKGRARAISKSGSPQRSHTVRISAPPVSSTRSARDPDDRSRLRASSCTDSSLSDEDDTDTDDDEDEDEDEDEDSGESGSSFSGSDSEEDEFPVNPTSADLANRRRLSQYPAQSDPLESYLAKQQKKAWQQAQASHNRDLAALRSIRLNAFTQASEQSKRLQAEELEMTTMLLADLNMRRQKEEEEIDREFQNRNKARWNDINRAISELEKAENEAIAIAKKKQAEAEARAREMRQAEMRKIELEKEEQRKKQEEQQVNEKSVQEQKAKAEQAANERARKEKEEADKAAVGTSAGGAPAVVKASSSSTGSALLDSKREFEKWHTKIKELKETVLPTVSNNKDLKNACWKVKRSISTRISNVAASATDIKDTSKAIHDLLEGAKMANENAYLWSLNLLSKKITEMAGNNSEPDLSPVTYALGQIVVSLLLAGHTAFGDILMARLVKRCPYIVPFFPSRGTLSPDEHSKLLARKEGEPPISYKQRMSGIVSFYAAIVQTSPSSVPHLTSTSSLSSIPSHFRPEGGWRWLALIVRPPLPLLEITALVLYTFLRMASERFHVLFGKQYIKLLQAIGDQAIDQKKVKWNDSVQGDLSKIRLMIGDWMEKGQIQGGEGRIPT